MITVKNVKATDQDNAIAAIVQAFSADPAARWMYPDTQQYLEYFPSFVKAFAGAAFERRDRLQQAGSGDHRQDRQRSEPADEARLCLGRARGRKFYCAEVAELGRFARFSKSPCWPTPSARCTPAVIRMLDSIMQPSIVFNPASRAAFNA